MQRLSHEIARGAFPNLTHVEEAKLWKCLTCIHVDVRYLDTIVACIESMRPLKMRKPELQEDYEQLHKIMGMRDAWRYVMTMLLSLPNFSERFQPSDFDSLVTQHSITWCQDFFLDIVQYLVAPATSVSLDNHPTRHWSAFVNLAWSNWIRDPPRPPREFNNLQVKPA
jgi:hypothetical protein